MNIPKGYKLVPVEPTQEMLNECEDAGSIHNHKRGARIYRAMLAAAATPPQPIYDEAKELADCRASWEKSGVGVVFADYWTGWQSRAKAGEVADEK